MKERDTADRSPFRDKNKVGLVGLLIKIEIPNRKLYIRTLVLGLSEDFNFTSYLIF